MVKYVKIRLEDETHLEFRKMCLEAGTNMQQRLTDLIVRDIQKRKTKKESIEDEGHEETNGYYSQQVEVAQPVYEGYEMWEPELYGRVEIAYPKIRHKAYKDRFGDIIGSGPGEKYIVRFDDGEEVIFLDEEFEEAEFK